MLNFLLHLMSITSDAFGIACGIDWFMTKIKEHQKSNRRFPK
jgi:hypothetical protein